MIHSVSLQCLILTLSSLTTGFQHTTQEIPAGHVFPLKCDLDNDREDMEIRWGSEKQQELDVESLPAGMKIINRALWFFPAQLSHSGNYHCSSWSNHSRVRDAMTNFSIRVANRTSSPRLINLSRDRTGFLDCMRDPMIKIFQLDPKSHVSWIKNGSVVGGDKSLRLPNVTERDEGEYTCSVNFTYEGNVYTAAQTFKINTHYVPTPTNPIVVKPREEVYSVTVGSRLDFNCKAFVGTDQDDLVDPSHIYWLVDGQYAEDVSEHLFVINNTITLEDNLTTVYYYSYFTILDIQKEFLHIPFTCIILNSKGTDSGTVTLIPATESYWVMLLVAGCLVVVLGLLVFHLFKVDLVLAYRKLSPCLQSGRDGKLYDGYVSYSHGNDQSVSFALQILPEILEDHLGYKLFISGRDNLPGAAAHDIIADVVKKCRRLIIVLGSRSSTGSTHSAAARLQQEKPAEHLNNNAPLSDPAQTTDLDLDPYEWSVGLYDALVKGGLKIILVQVGGEVDEAQLPESLRYIRRTQGILRWKQDFTTKPSGRFWKQLRYRMPAVQKVKMSAVV